MGRLGETACARWRAAWVSWVAFMDNLAWFRRGWVIQETVLKDNHEVTVVMGDTAFNWNAMLEFAALLQGTTSWLNQMDHYGTTRGRLSRYRVQHMNHRVAMPDQIRALVSHDDTSDAYPQWTAWVYGSSSVETMWWARVFEIMSMLREKDFGDDRDHVFACIGMAKAMLPPGMSNPLVVDYAIPVEEVFTRMAALFIAHMPLLRILSAVEPHEVRRYRNLPSWVPDLSVSQGTATFMRSGTGKRLDAGATKFLEWPRPTIDGNVLTVQGARLDVVPEAGVNFNHPTFLSTVLQACLQSQAYIANGETQPEAVFRTLLADGFFTELYASAFLPRCKTWLENFIVQEITGRLADDEDAVMGIALLLSEAPGSPHGQVLPDLTRITTLRDQAAACVAQLANDRFHGEFLTSNHGRRFFVTAEGFLGLGSESMRPGDEVFLVTGAKVPFVLRKVEGSVGDDEYRLVGECYLRGFMHGEGMSPDFRARLAPIQLV